MSQKIFNELPPQGTRYFKVVVGELGPRIKREATVWIQCDCGIRKLVRKGHFLHGGYKSCGCQRVAPKHGHTRFKKGATAIYWVWHAMKKRCLLPSDKEYANYGGRGITVCERWLAFENFFADMGHAPPGKSLDRIDNDKGYSKDNCRWATGREQLLNTRRSAWIDFNGERHRVRDIEISLGLSQGALWQRLKKGWSVNDACSTPKLVRS